VKEKEITKLGLIGVGSWGKNYIKTISALKGVTLSKVGCRDERKIDFIDKECQIYTSWKELIDSGGIDGLIVAVPPDVQYQIARYAIKKKLPLLLEKPLTTDLNKARHLCELANNTMTPVLVDHIYLFHPAYKFIKSILTNSNNINKIVCRRGKWGPFRNNVSTLWDWAPHDIAMCIDLVGEYPSNIESSIYDREKVGNNIGEIIKLKLFFADKTEALITIGNIFREQERLFYVEHDNEELIFDDLAKQKLVNRKRDCEKPISIPDEMPLSVLVNTFINGIKGGDKSMFGLEQSMKIVEIIADAEGKLLESISG